MTKDREPASLEIQHAVRLEEAARCMLGDSNLSDEDREVLEKAVRIARAIRKGLKAAG